MDADRYNSYCFETGNLPFEYEYKIPDWSSLDAALEKRLKEFTESSPINNLRRAVSEACLNAAQKKGIYRLNVPTGGGKTLASLRYALNHAKLNGMDRIIIVIPYLSVLEQTAQETKKALKLNDCNEIILEHHSNYVVKGGDKEAQTHALLTDRWNAPIVITTMVQFLESLYSGSSGDLRKIHNMSNSVIIIDEIQSLPIKCVYLFNEAVNFLHYCAGSTVLLCTATQPPLHKTEKPISMPEESDLIGNMFKEFACLRRTRIVDNTIRGGYSTIQLKDFALEQFDKNGNCLVILNTKTSALKLYKAVKRQVENDNSDIDVVYLSANMCPAHRLEKLNKIKSKAQKNVLCISTQLIEAGVDISSAVLSEPLRGWTA